VAEEEPGQGVPPQVVEQVRVRVAEPVCVTHEALQTDQADCSDESTSHMVVFLKERKHNQRPWR
jgi:hypothetical protein